MPPLGCDHLVGVEADLDDVVDEGEERREGERRHEQRDEAVLNHCGVGKMENVRMRSVNIYTESVGGFHGTFKKATAAPFNLNPTT